MKCIKIPNSKGQKIASVIHRPDINTNKLAILCPGFLDTKDYPHLVALAEALAKQGYTAIRFDPIGTWESEGDNSEYLTSQYIKDIGSVLEYMIKEGDYKYILLGGHSRGGQVSILYAARDPRISEVLGIMPSSLPVEGQARKEWEKSGLRISYRDVPNSDEQKEFKVPFLHVLDRDQFDAFADMNKIKVPVVLIAGELDISVSWQSVKKLFDNANEPKKFILAKGIDHEYRHRPVEIEKINSMALEALSNI